MTEDPERRFFKLPTGYMHVDARGIAFTRSGNWAEATTAKERSSRASVGRIVRIVLGIALVLVGMTFYAMKGLRGNGPMAFVVAAAGAAFGMHKLLTSVKNDFAQSFFIPFSKVRSLSPADDGLRITFVNGAWKEDEVQVVIDPSESEWVRASWESRRG